MSVLPPENRSVDRLPPFGENNSSKSGGELRILQYFSKNHTNIPGFPGRPQDIPRDELPLPRDFAFPPIPITANPFPRHFCNYSMKKGQAVAEPKGEPSGIGAVKLFQPFAACAYRSRPYKQIV
jgi:hypothetical protein